jgi:hypothetical protein
VDYLAGIRSSHRVHVAVMESSRHVSLSFDSLIDSCISGKSIPIVMIPMPQPQL